MSNICGGKDSHSQCQEGSYFKTATSVGKDVEKWETLHTVGGSEKWCSHYGNQYGDSSFLVFFKVEAEVIYLRLFFFLIIAIVL